MQGVAYCVQPGVQQANTVFNEPEGLDMTENAPQLTPLAQEKRAALPTAEAAAHLSRAQQTLRIWAMRDGSGPIRPIRVNGRLMWPVAQLRELLGVAL